MSHSPTKFHLSINTRQSFLFKQVHNPSLTATGFSNAILAQNQNQNISEIGILPRQTLLAKTLNPLERISTLEKKMMKILLNVMIFLIKLIISRFKGRKNK